MSRGLHDEVVARREGGEAAWEGRPIHVCPYGVLRLVAAWRNGWSAARAKRRAVENDAHTKAMEAVSKKISDGG